MERSDSAISPRLPRRTDIQSLRALAIALVVAAHAHMPGMQGGYIGVDIFFVLSGYLISGLILTEVESTRRFNPFAFYARRLKRLLPALLLVLLVVAGVAWLLASPQREGADAAAGQAAALWLSNFYFSARVINYFSAGLGSNLFLHTWSLAVEEQFYLIWPWLLLFLFGVWRWQGSPFSRRRLAIGFSVVAAISLAAGVYWAQTNIEVGFYLMPGRAWEFALGALTFLLRQECEAGTEKVAWLRRWLGRSLLNTAGLVLMLIAASVLPETLRYPGLWALLPCVGAVLFLLDTPEKVPTSLMSRLLLRQPLLQFFGDISYSLYLWHWPVLILGGEILGREWWVRTGLAALSVVLATITYLVVERPIHRARLHRPLRVFVPSMVGMALGFFVMGTWQGAVQNLLHTPEQINIERAMFDLPTLYNTPGCDTWYHSSQLRPCVVDSPGATHTVVMFGDSVLAQWFPAVAEIYLKHPGWRLVVLTKSSCPASRIHFVYNRIKGPYTVCDRWRSRAVRYMHQLHPDVIIMGSTHYDFSSQQWISGTRAVLDQLSPAARSVVIMSPTPELGFNGLDCLSARAHWPRWLPARRACMRRLRPLSKSSVSAALRQAAKPYPNVHVIDMRQVICPHDVCRAKFRDHIEYRDALHLTASFVELLAPALQQALKGDRIAY